MTEPTDEIVYSTEEEEQREYEEYLYGSDMAICSSCDTVYCLCCGCDCYMEDVYDEYEEEPNDYQ